MTSKNFHISIFILLLLCGEIYGSRNIGLSRVVLRGGYGRNHGIASHTGRNRGNTFIHSNTAYSPNNAITRGNRYNAPYDDDSHEGFTDHTEHEANNTMQHDDRLVHSDEPLPTSCKINESDNGSLDQSLVIYGVLRCNNTWANDVTIKIYDFDSSSLDDLIAEGQSDVDGQFCIVGHANKSARFTPEFNIYHSCSDFLTCDRKRTTIIFREFDPQNQDHYNVYDMGVMELSGKVEDEYHRSCLDA